MGTRADFYREAENQLNWIASIAWDGYPNGIYIKNTVEEDRNKSVVHTDYLTDCESEERYLEFLSDFLSGRDDVSYPIMGWPWPWENSRTTDYAYVFSNERKEVLIAGRGRGWFNQKELDEQENLPSDVWEALPKVDFPDMTDKMNVAFGKRSGLLVFKSKG